MLVYTLCKYYMLYLYKTLQMKLTNLTTPYKWVFLVVLSVMSTLFSQLSLFLPTMGSFEKMNMVVKTGISIALLFVQWIFIIPFIRIGLTLMNPIQITIFVFLETFLMQLITNVYVFGNKNTIDDYVASVLMIIGIVISKMKLVG
jgi:hypothetical protein